MRPRVSIAGAPDATEQHVTKQEFTMPRQSQSECFDASELVYVDVSAHVLCVKVHVHGCSAAASTMPCCVAEPFYLAA